MIESDVSRDEYKNLIASTKNDMEDIFKETKKSSRNILKNLQTWENELKERHQGLISRASFLDFICYLFMGVTSIYFIFRFFCWIVSTFSGSMFPLSIG